MEQLIRQLQREGVLVSKHIIEAFSAIDRKDFVPAYLQSEAYEDEALPIGYGQTISQPYVVAFMLEKLEVQPGHTVMDVGAGSAWTTALLAHIVGQSGFVVGIEIIPELAEFGRDNLNAYSFLEEGRARYVSGNGLDGYEDKAPYDRIMASSSFFDDSDAVPAAWSEQLASSGVVVFPRQHSLWRYKKMSEDTFEKEEYPGFVFVPMREKS